MEEVLLRMLKVRQERLQKCITAVTAEYTSGEMPFGTATSTIVQLKDLVYKLEREVKNYVNSSSGPNMELVNKTIEEQLQGEDLINTLEASLSVTNTMRETETLHTLNATKLPKLELPKFNGDRLRWNEFWDRFQSSIHSTALAEADKLSYLLGSLEGTALEAVAGLTITNLNYTIAIDTLKTRFGSNEQLIDAHYSALSNLPRSDQDAQNCRKNLDEVERHLRILEQLGENVNGNHLRAVILGKFPEQIVHQYHLTKMDNETILNIRHRLDKIVTAMQVSQGLSFKAGLSATEGITTEALHIKIQPENVKEIKKVKYHSRKRKGDPLPQKDNKRSKYPCVFCQLRNHNSIDCRKFKTLESRKKKLEGRCLNCLRRNHRTLECTRKITCYRCKGKHLQLLCPKPKGEIYIDQMTETRCQTIYNHPLTFLQTAVALVQNPNYKEILQKCRLILDSGSQRSYITSNMVTRLGLSPVEGNLLLVYTFGASIPKQMSSPSVDIIIQTKRGITRAITVNVVPHITERLPIAKLNYTETDLLADDKSVGESVDLLIGNDYYFSFMRESKIQIGDMLYVVDSDFGWVLSGNVIQNDQVAKRENALTVTTYCHCHNSDCPYFTEPDLPLRNIDIKFLWSMECIGITDSPKASRQEEAVKHFNNTIQYQDGRYEVKWPWIEYPPPLSINYGLALGRLKSLVKRLDMKSLKEYDEILKDQLNSNVIETVQSKNSALKHPVHYIAHHMVKQEGKPGRIVYDASAKTLGKKSLNECLYSGPSMLEDLTALLLKFRTKPIGIVADVEKAFLQIGLQIEDRDVTRFLWLKDIDKEPIDDNILCLRFCRVPFGIISSPFLLTATIRYHMCQSNGDLLKAIADNCYVDNLVTGAYSIQEAQQIYVKTKNTFEQLSMNIRDWVSNEREFIEMVPVVQRAKQSETVKILGLIWNPETDVLKLNVTKDHFDTKNLANTKRKVLRAMARIYDPCGFVCPLILPLKLLFRDICERKLKWDSTLPEDLIQTLMKILEELKTITIIQLPRFSGLKTSDPNLTYELHCFSDASKNAYATVIYIRTRSRQSTSVSFLMGKSRLAKIEKESELKIPKLELLGFLIASRLLKYVKSNLNLPILKEALWTDSLVVLGWMRSNKLLPPFVANRVEEIKRNQPQCELYYVNTKSNPADVATRPEMWRQNKELWFNGPKFLTSEETCWPNDRHYDAHKTLVSVGSALEQTPKDQHSNGQDLLYKELCNDLMEMDEPESSMTEKENEQTSLLDCTTAVIKELQHRHFPDEIAGKTTHLAKNLCLFKDADGILRCRGRMQNTTWDYDMKYPILLPKECELTNKIIKEIHDKNYHVGVNHTLSLIREKYWIPQGKTQVQKVIKKCVPCIKHGGGPYRLPPTPALPAERVNYSCPFSFTGVDYFGPLYVRTSQGKEKRWVALFTCLTIRAIHLEVVNDLSAEETLLAIRRFTACRNSTPKRFYSDNATYFKLVSDVFKKPHCVERKMEWKFIPQLAPWHGGFYERLVAIVKHCLKRTLEKHLIQDSKLLTVLKEVEAVVNSRPLTKVSTEVDHILRPADFLTLGNCLPVKTSTTDVPCMGTATKIDLIESWRRGLIVLEEFKKMFINQYLLALRERYHHSPKQPRIKSSRSPNVGDIVQIKADSKNRENWKVGRIVDLMKGADGEHRVAKVKVNGTTFIRSVGHLYPLEDDSINEKPSEQEETRHSTLDLPIQYINEDELGISEDSSIGQTNGKNCQNQKGDFPSSSLENEKDVDGETLFRVETELKPVNESVTIEDKVPRLETELGSINENVMVEELDPNHVNNVENSSQDISSTSQNVEQEHVTTTAMKSRRSAAIRAREKILEWTHRLLTMLQ